MASLITCRVHPVVLLTMIDAHERRADNKTNKVIGTLLGYFEKGVIEVTNCYPVPHSEDSDEPKLRIGYNKEMYELYKKSNQNELPVGWFSTHPEVREMSTHYHDYYHQFVNSCHQTRDHMPIVLLTLDTLLKNGRMGMKAFIRMHAGIPKAKSEQCTIFMPIDVDLTSFETEQVGVDCIFRGTLTPKRTVDLSTSVEQIGKVSKDMLTWIAKIKAYVDEVLADKRVPESSVGRKLMEIVSNVNQVAPEQFEAMLGSSMKDYLMVIYLARLAKTQLSLHQKLVTL